MSGAVGLLAEITLDQFGSCGLSNPTSAGNPTTSDTSADCSTQRPSRGIMNFSKADLLRLLGLLEAELQARELVIVSLKAERVKLLRPAGSQQRYTLANPYTALGRDLDSDSKDNTNSSSGNTEEDDQENKGSNALACLEAMVAKHKKAEAEMRTQLEGLKKSHAKVVAELDEEKRKHASDTAQGDDVTYMLEKERERLAQQLEFERAQQKKLEKETKRSQAALIQERKKHLQFAKVILDERKVLLMELGEMKQHMEELEDMMIVKEAQLASAKGCLQKERKRLTKMEAGMEKRLSEFDIEREQLRAKLNREESRTRELREELDVANNCINDLQLSLAEARHTDASNGNQHNPTSATNGGDAKGKPLGRVTGSPISAAKTGKISTPRGIRTPPRYDKSEGSSSGSEELCSPLSPVTSATKHVPGKPQKNSYQPQYGTTVKPTDARSVESDNGKPEVKASAKQKGSLLYSKGNGKPLSPASSLDRLNRAHTSSPPPQRGSKIPSSTGNTTRSSLMSPQQNRKGSAEIEKPSPRQPPAQVPSPKPTATNLVRPTALSSSPFLRAVDAFKAGPKKAAGLPGAQPSPVVFQPANKAPSPSVPKAAVSPLVSTTKKPQTFKPPTPTQPAMPVSKINPPSPSSAISPTGAEPSSQPAKTGVQPPTFTPPVKRTVSPRGTPPPVPPNKPTLIPQKTNASSSPCTSTTTITSPATTPLSRPDANKNTCPLAPPPVSVRRSDSLVEARRQFYTNKLSGGQTNPRGGGLDNQLLISANNNSNNSNALDTLAIDTNDDFLYDASEQPGPPLQNHAQAAPTAQKSTTQVGGDMQSVLKLSGATPIHSDHGFYHNTLGPRPEGSSPVIARLPPSTASPSSPLHLAAVEGDTATICRLIEENHSPTIREIDGSTPVHAAAEHGQLDCLELLLDLGGDANIARTDGVTPLHSAAGQGHAGCLSALLDRDCNLCTPDSLGWYPLHWAAANGHAECVRILIDRGAPRDCVTKGGWTPLHCAAKYSHAECLQILLYHAYPTAATTTHPDNSQPADRAVSCDLLNMADQEGWTAAHVAASTGQKECLEVLCNYGDLNLDARDKWRKTPIDVSIDSCKEFFSNLVGRTVHVSISLGGNTNNLLSNQREANQCYVAGQLTVRPGMTWTTFDRCMASVLCSHSRDLEGYARLKSEPDNESDEGSDCGQDLGLNAGSIDSYVAGNLQWSPGKGPQSMQPYELFGLTTDVVVHLCGIDAGRLDQLAYETLIPTATLQNYVRLIEQYKSVVFYGPAGTGKTLLASRLAEYVKTKQHQLNLKSTIHHIALHSKMNQQDLTKLLCSKGVFIQSSDLTTPKAFPILVIDNLDKSTLPGVLSDLLKGLEHRGTQQPIQLSSPQGSGQFHLHPECTFICTMDKSSSGLDLSSQHCFRWVQLHHDREPVASTLPRYLLRRLVSHTGGRLPQAEDPAYRAMEWVCHVWQRLNDCFLRLKLKPALLGPRHFRACPVDSEGPNSVFRWFCLSWNHAIAPQIEDTLRRKSSSNSHNYQRLVSTTLYVLLQRAVFPGCPFTGEADDYMSSFRGVNELLAQLSSQKTNSLKRSPRRSKSLDRNKSSNKAALMASKRQSALDLDSQHADLHRSTRSMIPRRVPKSQSKLTSDGNSNPVGTIQQDLIPSSPIEDSDLLESLLQLQGCPLDSDMDQLTQLQENLLGRKPGGSGAGAGVDKAAADKGKKTGDPGAGSEKQMKRPSPDDGTAGAPGGAAGRHEKLRKKNKDEDGVWDVWEETV
ncbi:cortactin-binding protein 2-like isoform X2 [Acanthaster planci]|uniref:Cortactin-binding protein 2 n=1 Tax=Acanthaster planci TaxID=133434 RepID=A0A8B7XMR0_ACAPL|nr:cortactin-binding protein 2-like isoform X2 [Acanthaster planci]